jgi:SAM-dependent methyltransferase
LLPRREPKNLNVAHIIQTIDREEFEKIRARYGMENPGEEPPKYLDLPRWIEANLWRVRDLDLDLGPRQRILDIGSGAGYFLYICGLLGHDAVGIDLDISPMFTATTGLLGVQRSTCRVQAFVPLPDLGEKFDVITAHMICFNGHKSENLWGPREWGFFLDDLTRYLAPRGRIWLQLNREYDGTCYTPELKKYFEKRGGEVAKSRVVFNSIRPASA